MVSEPGRFDDRHGLEAGSIERTLAGGADLRIGMVVREAWDRIDGIKGMVNAGVLLIYAAMMLAVLAMDQIFSVNPEDPVGGALTQLVIMIVLYPFLAGVFLFGLRRSLGQPVRFEEQFSQFGRALPILAVAVLQSTVTGLGFMLLIVPGIYFSIALSLALPLKAERDLPVLECLGNSLRLVNRKFWEVAALSLISGLLMAVGVLSLIGWIWTLPWVLMIYSITYRQLAGSAMTGSGRGSDPRVQVTAEY